MCPKLIGPSLFIIVNGVIQLKGDDNFAANTNNSFGLASAGGAVHGLLADAGADIF